MKKLEWKDFQLAITDDRQMYYSFEFKDYEICLEPCLSGFDVAIYRIGPDERIGDLVEPKKCSDMKFPKRSIAENNRNQKNGGERFVGINGLKKGEKNMLRLRVLKLANEFYKKYNN
ncbi:MAG: hypothetical protein EOL88_00665 [Bacteroidia bacterium]|nr:hypothetical protein [Bacteroidia bacterium]